MTLRPACSPSFLLRRALAAIASIKPQWDHPRPQPQWLSSSSLLAPSRLKEPDDVLGKVSPKRFFASGGAIKATLFPGDGIGPEIAESVKQVGSKPSTSFVSSVLSILGFGPPATHGNEFVVLVNLGELLAYCSLQNVSWAKYFDLHIRSGFHILNM